MNERLLAKNKTSATPPQACQASSPLLHLRPLTDELSESVGSNSNISKESAGIQPKTIRRRLNWQNITVEAPHRSSASSTSPGGIQRLETSEVKEQEESKEEQNKELVQTKLTVGAPGDKYEQEADSMAAKVMRMPDSAIQQSIQRQTGEDTEAVQMQPLVNSITPLVQRSSGEQEKVQRIDEKQAAIGGANLSKAEARGTLERIRELLNKKDNAKLKGEFEQRLRELDKGWAKNSEELEGIAGDSELEEIVTDEFKGITEKAKALESEIQDKLPKAAEAPPYVQRDRPAFDEETFLADSSKYIKTKKTFQGRAIYKDTDGRYYHVDNLHRGEGSEIEYYNSQGVHLGTLKPDGTPKGDAVKGRYLFD